MSGIIDYLKWRGDLPFGADPFNEVDSLILSELVYVDYADLPDEMTDVSLEEAYYRYLKKNPAAGTQPDAPGSEKILLLNAYPYSSSDDDPSCHRSDLTENSSYQSSFSVTVPADHGDPLSSL